MVCIYGELGVRAHSIDCSGVKDILSRVIQAQRVGRIDPDGSFRVEDDAMFVITFELWILPEIQ